MEIDPNKIEIRSKKIKTNDSRTMEISSKNNQFKKNSSNRDIDQF